MQASVLTYMGGCAAEEIISGTMTTGSANDFKIASDIARDMVCNYGMSSVGKVVYAQHEGAFNYSQKTAETIDQEVKRIVESSYAKAVELLNKNKEKLEMLAQALIDKETMHAGEIYELLNITPRQEHRFV